MTLIVACGLKREARIIEGAGRDVVAVVGGGTAARLERNLDDQIEMFPGIVLSCGIAGALIPSLRPGDVVIGGDADVLAPLRAALSGATVGRIIGSDTIAATSVQKHAIAARTGGIAVDMESHIAARVTTRRGLPFGAVRVISDRLEDDLPPAALVGMKPDGGMALGAVLASLAKAPGQLPALLRTGRQADAAFAGLKAAMAALFEAGLDRIELNHFGEA